MKPLEPDPGDAQTPKTGLDIDHTFRQLLQAEHAPADFHAQVMARAEQLPPPRRKRTWRSAMTWALARRLPRPATIVLASILLLCIAGLGYLYLQVAELQAMAEQERLRRQQHRQEIARLQNEYAAQQRRQGKFVETLNPDERVALTEVSLEVPQSPAEGEGTGSAESTLIGLNESAVSHEPSILSDIMEVVQGVFRTVWRKIQGVTNSAPADSSSSP